MCGVERFSLSLCVWACVCVGGCVCAWVWAAGGLSGAGMPERPKREKRGLPGDSVVLTLRSPCHALNHGTRLTRAAAIHPPLRLTVTDG